MDEKQFFDDLIEILNKNNKSWIYIYGNGFPCDCSASGAWEYCYNAEFKTSNGLSRKTLEVTEDRIDLNKYKKASFCGSNCYIPINIDEKVLDEESFLPYCDGSIQGFLEINDNEGVFVNSERYPKSEEYDVWLLYHYSD